MSFTIDISNSLSCLVASLALFYTYRIYKRDNLLSNENYFFELKFSTYNKIMHLMTLMLIELGQLMEERKRLEEEQPNANEESHDNLVDKIAEKTLLLPSVIFESHFVISDDAFAFIKAFEDLCYQPERAITLEGFKSVVIEMNKHYEDFQHLADKELEVGKLSKGLNRRLSGHSINLKLPFSQPIFKKWEK